MRRTLALVTTAALVVALSSIALATTPSKVDYKDTFQEPAYNGSDGSLEWVTDWGEKGEQNGPDTGAVQAVAHDLCPEGSACMYISGNGILSSVGAYRFADTSDMDDLKLCYKIRRINENDVLVDPPVLHVQVTSDGESWATKRSYTLDVNDDGYLYESVGIEGYSSPEFGVRFVVSGLLPELETVGVFIDWVWVEGLLPQSTTTTSSTTSTSSTSSTSSTTTTTKPSTTSTSEPRDTATSSSSTSTSSTTTTTLARDTTTTTVRDTTTTTKSPDTTTTTEALLAAPPDGPPPESGIRQAAAGIQASFGTNAYGDVSAGGIDVLGVELEADYSMAAEIIEYSWIWMLGLVLLIATAVVSGMDRRRVGMGSIR